ncbi:hypothetical protein FIBSPDRAFT_967392 [Athelia psychrophila]|uniref:CCHC-type domain-containing protein n=1 Tax=Athelia psychrophila TaxID=1759441 RepID=A0A167VSL5_9AGAM|nr:hypothetical protein FIBSPDRAFT_967392 [Fibularhizoctonia sp. CBS 109695]
MTSAFTTKLGDDFLRVPKLTADGKNFVVYRDRLALAVLACGLDDHLDGTATRPADPSVRDQPFDVLTEDKQNLVTAHCVSTCEWARKEAVATVSDAWKLLKEDFEKRSRMYMVDLRRRLQDQRCKESGDVRTHFDIMCTMREDIAALGDDLTDDDFGAMLLGSLPRSYDNYLSAISATLSVLGKSLDPESFILSVTDEFDRRSVKSRQPKDKSRDAAFFAGGSGSRFGGSTPKFGGSGFGGGSGSRVEGRRDGKSLKDVECYHCHKKGHMKRDCFKLKGESKDGQGARGRDGWKGKGKDMAGVAEGEDRVWMAAVDDSSDDLLGDDEGDDEDWFWGEGQEEEQKDSTHLDDLISLNFPSGIDPRHVTTVYTYGHRLSVEVRAITSFVRLYHGTMSRPYLD